MELAEFKAEGGWRLTNVFQAGGAWMNLNGNMVPNIEAGGFLNGEMTGQPLFSCGICGTGIMEHYTFTNKQTGEQRNVGSTCVHHVLGEKRADTIIKGIKSLHDKVIRDFKRVIYQEQLIGWIKENMVELERLQNVDVDKRKADALTNPKNDKVAQDERKFWFDGSKTFYHEKWITYGERDQRVLWQKMVNGLKSWNPQNMAKTFKDIISKYDTQIEVPKCRKLTNEEQIKLRGLVQSETDRYIARLKAIEERSGIDTIGKMNL